MILDDSFGLLRGFGFNVLRDLTLFGGGTVFEFFETSGDVAQIQIAL
jgi:hypothetical protein